MATAWRAIFVTALALTGACRSRPTQVTLFLDTNVSSAREASVTITMVDGEASIEALRLRRSAPQVGMRSALPGSLTLIPREGAARTGTVTLLATLSVAASGEQPATLIERYQRLSWIERTPQQSRLFFNARCSDRAVGCASATGAECTVSRRCIEQSATCGDNGECVAIELPTVALPMETALDANVVADVAAPMATDATASRADGAACEQRVFDPAMVNALSTGEYHACSLRAGALWCWGRNGSGELGLGDTMSRSAPAAVLPAQRWIDVAAAESSTCALDEFGRAWCWGGNTFGQLGQGDTTERRAPTMIEGTCGLRDIEGRYNTFCAIDLGGALRCWGDNAEGQLSDEAGSIPYASAPLRIGASSDWTAARPAQGHTCALRAPGTLHCWGRNSSGELGLGAGQPQQVRAISRAGTATDWRQISTGQHSSCGVRADGSAYCWGENDGFDATHAEPTRVGAGLAVVQVDTDVFHYCVLDNSGVASCAGRNVEQQLADRTTVTRNALAPAQSAARFARIGVGRFFTCAREASGAVHCAGENADGQLGVGDLMRRDALTPQ